MHSIQHSYSSKGHCHQHKCLNIDFNKSWLSFVVLNLSSLDPFLYLQCHTPWGLCCLQCSIGQLVALNLLLELLFMRNCLTMISQRFAFQSVHSSIVFCGNIAMQTLIQIVFHSNPLRIVCLSLGMEFTIRWNAVHNKVEAGWNRWHVYCDQWVNLKSSQHYNQSTEQFLYAAETHDAQNVNVMRWGVIPNVQLGKCTTGQLTWPHNCSFREKFRNYWYRSSSRWVTDHLGSDVRGQ